MFKFKGISSEDMQVVVAEEEHFIARASQRYEMTEIDGRDGAIFDALGYSVVERPIYVQCLNIEKIDDILAWLNGEGEFEYKGRKTIARFYSQLEPQRSACIRIIDATFIRNPFWSKSDDEFEIVKRRKDKNITGENIYLTDSAEYNFKKFGVGGNSVQETRSGKNELKNTATTTTVNGITFTVNSDGTVIANGTATSIAQINIGKPVIGTYKYTGCPSGGAFSNGYRMRIRNNESPYTEYGTDIGTGTKCTFENVLDSDVISLTIDSGVTVNNLVFKPMISVEGGEYEPYGVMPSPEFSSEIKNVDGNINIKVYNKNLLNLSKCTFKQCTLNEDGSIKSNINNYYYCYINTTELNELLMQNKGKNFNFSIGTDLGKQIAILIFGTRKNGLTYQEENAGGNNITINVAEDFINITKIEFRFNRANTPFTDTTTTIPYVQFEFGDKATDYIGHEEQTITFPLSEGQKLMLGDYLAEDGIHHKKKQFVLDGSETDWEKRYSAVNQGIAQYTKSLNHNNTTGACTYFKVIDGNTVYYGVGINFNKSDSKIYINVPEEITPNYSLPEWKQWLSTHNTIVEYELAEEEIEPYTTEQQAAYNKIKELYSYKGITHITCEDEVSPVFEVTYITETNEKILNAGNIQSRPILRLEKTISDSIELTVNNVRFKYNFNGDKYVEIDCEEKTIKYENLNRSRQIEIGYEFPKLEIGNNDIIMHTGDCIIQAKRKDRWL